MCKKEGNGKRYEKREKTIIVIIEVTVFYSK